MENQKNTGNEKVLKHEIVNGKMTTSKGKIRLVNAIFYAHHGVSEAEHKVGARYEVDVELTYNFTEAGATDSLSKTVDYEKVYKIMKEVITPKKYYLIEKVAKNIAEELKKDFADIEEIKVKVRKRNPPVGGVCDYAEVEYALT
ncbi:MAG: dihydroneopterin aldolase [Chloroherpetonaceae bacterium]|nr:dihydroneopterin aldolase [Chloroherpetonaceae bacterium]